ncbi:DUF4012 domain-containing protein [Arthrobacter sp. ISL-5]|nr:DUF4012 domain-containing protein [Arthrobacter sp. ISL-5]
MFVVTLVSAVWLGVKAETIKSELEAATQLIPQLKEEISSDQPNAAAETVLVLRSHTAAARESAGDPLWTLASALPGLGGNFGAVAEVARSADDVANLGLSPLVKVLGSLEWDSLLPRNSGRSLEPLRKAAPSVSSAAHAVRVSAERLESIELGSLLPQIAEPVLRAKEQLNAVTGALDDAADASQLAPVMLGADGPRNYLLMIQNNAEARASGGIPGALAVLTVDKGKLTLGPQSSAGSVGVMSPTLTVDAEQRQIYSTRIGKYMQDVNLTPDFPTAAATAQAMWERKTKQRVDGVLSIDPVALGYMLEATGPIKISQPELVALAGGGLPTELNGKNVVPTLLSDVYAKIEQPKLQDAYFAGVAQEIFSALSSGKGDAKDLVKGLARGTSEGRVLLWSSAPNEQGVLAKYQLSGSVAGPSISPAQFGVYFNDGTGAKMDYYVKRTAQLVTECTDDGYVRVKVRVTSTNNAPADAATSLPSYVTGGGVFGVPEGTVQTNIVAYGPVQSNVETVYVAGKKSAFASHRHSGRPVGSVTVRLGPGQSSTVEFTFDKIVQHTEPQLSVTPTVQALKDVVLDTVPAKCVPAA